MSKEIIQNVAYDNYHDFQHINSYFQKKLFHYFSNYFNDETDFRVRYSSCIDRSIENM